MTTSWRNVHTKLKESGAISQTEPSPVSIMLRKSVERRGSSSSGVTTNSSTPAYTTGHRPSIEHEWMPNYMFINRTDGL